MQNLELIAAEQLLQVECPDRLACIDSSFALTRRDAVLALLPGGDGGRLALHAHPPSGWPPQSQRLLDLPTETREPLFLFADEALDRTLIAFRTGEVVANNEVVGAVPERLCAAHTAPDGVHTALVAQNGTLLLMTTHWEVEAKWELEGFDVDCNAASDDLPPVSIAWRADGAYWAVSYLTAPGSRRLVIFSSRPPGDSVPCQLISPVGEHQLAPSLLPAMAWQPRPGGVLAVATDDGDVIFFEKNGLRHHRMDAALSETHGMRGRHLVRLCWSADASVLAVAHRSRERTSAGASSPLSIDLYAFSNYRWYRKYRLGGHISNHLPSSAVWMQFAHQRPLTLLYSLAGNDTSALTVHRAEFAWAVHKSRTAADWTAVIDGSRVHLTPLSRCLLPPPLFQSVCALPDDAAADDSVNALQWRGDVLNLYTAAGQAWMLLAGETRLKARAEAGDPPEPTAQRRLPLTTDGAELVWDVRDGTLELQPSSDRTSDIPPAITLASDCTSVEVVSNAPFILFTTRQDTLVCLPWAATDTLPSSRELHQARAEARPLDRGSVLIGALHDNMRVVLQAPRGNLECIAPRALALHRLRLQLLGGSDAAPGAPDFLAALAVVRRHSIEPRVVAEILTPPAFQQHASTLLTQLQTQPSTLCETLNTLLPSLARHATEGAALVDALAQAMRDRDERAYLLPLLTAYATHPTGPCLPQALQLLQAHWSEEALTHLVVVSKCSAERLFQTALGLYDLELAERVARHGRLDPQQYQPLLQALQQITQPALRQCEIDLFLGRYGRALEWLFVAYDDGDDEVPEAESRLLELVQARGLYEQALHLCHGRRERDPTTCSTLYRALSLQYAEHLQRTQRYLEAARRFAAEGALQPASEAYLLAGCGDLAMAARMTAADSTTNASSSLDAFAEAVAQAYERRGRWEEAARCWASPRLQQTERALQLLIDAHAWRAALHLAATHARPDWLRQEMLPALLEAARERSEEMRTAAAKYRERAARLALVREAKARLRLGQAAAEQAGEQASVAASVHSVASDLSSFTFATRSRSASVASIPNGRGRDAKTSKRRVKPGDPREEEYLVLYLRRLQPSLVLREAVHDILECLLLFGRVEEARTLQRSAQTLADAVQQAPVETSEEERAATPDTQWFSPMSL